MADLHRQNFEIVPLLGPFLPPATKSGQGNIFTSVCQEFCPWGSGAHVWQGSAWRGACIAGGMCGRHAPRQIIRDKSMSGQYASYWNTFLSSFSSSFGKNLAEWLAHPAQSPPPRHSQWFVPPSGNPGSANGHTTQALFPFCFLSKKKNKKFSATPTYQPMFMIFNCLINTTFLIEDAERNGRTQAFFYVCVILPKD